MRYFLFLFIFLPSFIFAQVWNINSDHSEIFFRVSYVNVSEVTGRFKHFSGSSLFGQDKAPLEVQLKIMSSSIETGNSLRDGHLRSQEFLKSKEYPFINFKSLAINKAGSNKHMVDGELSIAGVTRKHAIEFEISDVVKDTWNYESRFVKFKTSINRKDFNLKWNKTLTGNKYLVGDVITIWGTLQLQPGGAKTPSSKHMIPDTGYMRKREQVARGELPAGPEAPFKKEPQLVRPLQKLPEPAQTVPLKKEEFRRDFRDTFSWKISFGILGLMGFFASIIIGLYTKKMMTQKYPELYREGGLLGILTDTISIIFILLFVVALWEVGWG